MKKKKAKKEAKVVAKALKQLERSGLTKKQSVVVILGLYAEGGRLGPNMLRCYERLAREEGMEHSLGLQDKSYRVISR